ncbi:MAG: hypothetical protein PF518_07190 [Spirochaetaceae bacterium]|jgi:hypothetical protein|nr:hypothetical protein [Spirochaetaceae bacterium]
MFISNPKARKYFTLVTPETVLYRWKRAIKDYWTYDKPKTRKKGRPPITKAMKLLMKNLKIDNYLWGCKRIQDEFSKISIDISRETIRKVIQDYRKSGEIKPNYSWSRFLKSHWQSLFACDFFTVVRLVSSKLATWLPWDEETGRKFSSQDNLRFDAGRNSLSWR